jgi:hypothetical protein
MFPGGVLDDGDDELIKVPVSCDALYHLLHVRYGNVTGRQ